MARDPSYRPFTLQPGAPITVEIRGRDGTHLLVEGTVDAIPWSAGNVAQRVVVRDAVAKVLD